MSYDCPRRGPATAARLEKLGLPEIYKKGAPSKHEQGKMRRAFRKHAKANGDAINAMTKSQYKRAAKNALFKALAAEKAARTKEESDNKLSFNPEKAARMQAIRDAWARAKAD